jgi:hypothetical protein
MQTSSFKDLNQAAESSAGAVHHLRTSRLKSRSTSMKQAAKLRSLKDGAVGSPRGLVGAAGQLRRHTSSSRFDPMHSSIHHIASNLPSNFVIEISTYQDGYNSGRIYRLAANTATEMNEWLAQLQAALDDARTRHEIASRRSLLSQILSRTKKIYDSKTVQWAVGLLILINFSVSIWEAETRLVSEDYDATIFDTLEISFTAIFCAELLINLVASGLWAFVVDNWNLMDVVVGFSFLLACRRTRRDAGEKAHGL